MADILAIRDAIADAIVAGTDLRAYKGNRPTIETPCAVVPSPSVDYLEDIGRTARMTFVVRVMVGGVSEDVAQEALAAYVSTDPTGVPAIVEADAGLLSVVDTVAVMSAREPLNYSYGEGTSYMGVELTVVVVA